MDLHANAKLGLAGRRELVLAIEQGLSLRAAATAFSVSPATAHRWWHRWLEGGRAVSALRDRSSRPRSSAASPDGVRGGADPARPARDQSWAGAPGGDRAPRPLDDLEGALAARAFPSAARTAAELPPLRVVTSGCAAAHGREEARPLQRPWPPRHRKPANKDLHRGIGYDHLHCVVDDHSRIAYVELHPREDADTNVRTLERALAFFAELGLGSPEAVMTDNAMVYRNSRRFQTLLLRPRDPPHPHARLHAALERQGRALHPDPPERVGLQPQLAHLEQPSPQPAKLHPLLQPQTPTQLTRRPAPVSRVHNLCGQDT